MTTVKIICPEVPRELKDIIANKWRKSTPAERILFMKEHNIPWFSTHPENVCWSKLDIAIKDLFFYSKKYESYYQ